MIYVITAWIVGIPITYVIVRYLIEFNEDVRYTTGNGVLFSLTWPIATVVVLLGIPSEFLMDKLIIGLEKVNAKISSHAKRRKYSVRGGR